MLDESKEIIFATIVSSLLLLFLIVVIVIVILRYKRKQVKNDLEKEQLRYEFQHTLLQSQLEIQEQTFKNISQEIHDNIGQALTLAKLNLNTMPPADATLQEKITTTKELVSKAIVDLRDLSRSLNTDYIADMGLQLAIEYELNLICKSSAIQTSLHTTGKPFRMSQQKELILFRIVQEALNNILKHAGAQSIKAIMEYSPEQMKLSLIDDGKGFDPNEVKYTTGERGLGLRSMQNRAKLIGATFSIESIPGNGTSVQITLLKEAEPSL